MSDGGRRALALFLMGMLGGFCLRGWVSAYSGPVQDRSQDQAESARFRARPCAECRQVAP